MNGETHRTAAAQQLLVEMDDWCMRTETPESTIGHVLYRHPGFVALIRKRLMVTVEKEAEVRAFLAKHPYGYAASLPKLANYSGPKSQRMCDVRHVTLSPDRPPPVDRDPCGYCGVRGDVPCKHKGPR